MEAVLAPRKPLRLMLDAAVGSALLEACMHGENASMLIEKQTGTKWHKESDCSITFHPCMQVEPSPASVKSGLRAGSG